jgi:hypothetical protein
MDIDDNYVKGKMNKKSPGGDPRGFRELRELRPLPF